MPTLKTDTGVPYPMGASVNSQGVNFAVFSRHAKSVTLEFYQNAGDAQPYATVALDPELNKTGDIWHVQVHGLKPECLYLYRVVGPFAPTEGMRFNGSLRVFDPYAKAFSEGSVFKAFAAGKRDKPDMSLFPKCVVIDDYSFDWQGDHPLKRKLCDTIIYETHLKGFTMSPTSGVDAPGTYAGFIEKIPYLKKLGITAVEFMPVQEFDENENGNINPRTGKKLSNYWGYSTIGFFAPKQSYAADRTPGGCVNEFRRMVRELHKAGIEVILDVVYNHTAEGNEHGYTFEFRGLENSVYYILDKAHKEYYCNFSGCGNSFNANHPVARQFIVESLRYWVLQMHVDGFRFDLASEFSRGEQGEVLQNPPLPALISEDPCLHDTKIIAEPWDAAGVYQAGCYPGGRWSEWNDRFRDDMRKFFRGDEHMTTAAATRSAGSSDMFRRRGPSASVNYITAHDGFTLNDLVSYSYKHNEENGEGNCDGSDQNYSYNNGFEGPTTNPLVERMRLRQIKNFISCMMLSQGVPMLLAGDEFRRTQRGNNNAYCQDSDMSWIDWKLLKENGELFRFTKMMIRLRKDHPVFRRMQFFTGGTRNDSMPDIMWYDSNGKIPDWEHLGRFISFRLSGRLTGRGDCPLDNDFYCAVNMDMHDITLVLPPVRESKRWVRVVDTSVDSPDDFRGPDDEEILASQSRYVLLSGSVVVLMSKTFE